MTLWSDMDRPVRSPSKANRRPRPHLAERNPHRHQSFHNWQLRLLFQLRRGYQRFKSSSRLGLQRQRERIRLDVSERNSHKPRSEFEPAAISSSGEVVGYLNVDGGVNVNAAIYDNGTVTDLDSVDADSTATGVNASGDVVGSSQPIANGP